MNSDGTYYDKTAIVALVDGDPEGVRDLQQVFLDTNTRNLEILISAYEQAELTTLGVTAHTMKASIDIWNITALKTVIRTLEQSAKAGKHNDDIKAMVTEVERVMKIVLQEIRQDLQTGS